MGHGFITQPPAATSLDTQPSAGLLATPESIGYVVAEIDTHLHSREYWLGRNDSTGFFEDEKLAGWTVTAGTSEAWGAWLQIGDGSLVIPGAVKIDSDLIMVLNASANGVPYYFQFGSGEVGAQEIITTTAFVPASNQLDTGPSKVRSQRVDIGGNVWVRCKCVTNDATIVFVVGVHTYEG